MDASDIAADGASCAMRAHPSVLMTVAILAIAVLCTTPVMSADAFDALQGQWSGGGSARFASGQTERLRCTSRYSGGGENLNLNLRCASASAQINLSGILDADSSRVSGRWTETSFGLTGQVSGSTQGGSVRLSISGGTTGSVTLNVAGDRHTFKLSSNGTSLTAVDVTLARR